MLNLEINDDGVIANEKDMRIRFVGLIDQAFATSNPGRDVGKTASEIVADYLLANNAVILPNELGTKVYVLGQPCGGCHGYNEVATKVSIEMCRRCERWEIGECDFDWELVPEWGKYVFATEEEAQRALEVIHNERRKKTNSKAEEAYN